MKGFFASLFDLSFTSFITTRLVKVLYVLTLVLLVLAYLGIAVAIFSGDEQATTIGVNGEIETSGGGNAAFGIVWLLILGPLMLFLYTLLYRVFFELIIVVFRIYENTRDQLELTRRAVAGGTDPAPPGGSAPRPPA